MAPKPVLINKGFHRRLNIRQKRFISSSYVWIISRKAPKTDAEAIHMSVIKRKRSGVVPSAGTTEAAQTSLHRSGAVARMLRMPVSTLRVWERRYGLTQAALTSGGQRLYSADDVRRLALMKQLTDRGHAIGSLAALDMAQLQRVAATHAQALAATQSAAPLPLADEPPLQAPWRVAVVGTAWAGRLQRPSLLRQLLRPLVLLGPFDDVAQAAAALHGKSPDALLIHEPQLHSDWLAAFGATASHLSDIPKAVLFSFAADPVCEALAVAGTALLREPQPDAVVAQWLNSLSTKALTRPQPKEGLLAPGSASVPARRWNDVALADFANQPSTVACECPRHVAELLLQLAHFESYSAACEHRSAADAELHAYLRRTATASRVRFEAALEHVALHEGLMLPTPATNGAAA
jgi:DNA-binding transcriptional MerR regulator